MDSFYRCGVSLQHGAGFLESIRQSNGRCTKPLRGRMLIGPTNVPPCVVSSFMLSGKLLSCACRPLAKDHGPHAPGNGDADTSPPQAGRPAAAGAGA
jgi:hypothetical protein